MITLSDIRAAQSLLRGIAVRTPLLEWTIATAHRKLFLKLENLQPIGAFKLRGAYNKVASLSDEDRQKKTAAIRAETDTKIKPILTAEQWTKLEQLRAERKAQGKGGTKKKK